jgi:diguanylate cyclase (GGDEF)-like protein
MLQKETKQHRILREGQLLFAQELGHQLNGLKRSLEALKHAASLQDGQSIYRIAHMLKGSAAVFGYRRIGSLAERLAGLWEWTQDVDGDAVLSMETGAAALREALEASPQLIAELMLEYETAQGDLEKDESDELLQVSVPMPNGRLLIVDNDDVLRSYLVRRLRLDGYEADEANGVESAKKLLRERTYDLITLDLIMYPESGYQMFEFLKEDPTLKWIPLIVISGREDLADKVRCFYSGADDYVTKPFRYEELAARIYSLVKRSKSYEQLAFCDPLTGVYNRRYFDNQIQVELQRVERYPAPLSVVFLDIDRFKAINDAYGHQIGDLVLQGFAHAMQKRLRKTDLLARFGGEEFVIAMPNTTAFQAAGVVTVILHDLRKEAVAMNEGQEYRITFSAGVAEWKPELTLDGWLKAADTAMYGAKQQGRNRVLIHGVDTADADVPSASGKERRKSILIADDDHILRSILVGRLQELPVDIAEAQNGEEALEQLGTRCFDLCILDGVMPRVDGFAVLERIVLDPRIRLSRTRVLMLSGRRKEDETAIGTQLWAHDYMPKPFSLVELDLRVKRLLDL